VKLVFTGGWRGALRGAIAAVAIYGSVRMAQEVAVVAPRGERAGWALLAVVAIMAAFELLDGRDS
jgi:hypothetical protein